MVVPFLNVRGVALAIAEMGASARPRIVAGSDYADDATSYRARELSLEQMDAIQAEWADLAGRALEPNAFYEPGFALSAARHFPLGERPRFIVVRDPRWRMVGLFLVAPVGLFGGDGLLRLWLSKMSALAIPLVDRDAPDATLAAFFDWAQTQTPAVGVVFPRLIADGRFFGALEVGATRRDCRLETLDAYERAALLPGAGVGEKCAQAGGRKKLNEIHRMRRRLAEMGQVDFTLHETPEAVREAAETFLALETSGWKAGRGAFLSDPGLTTFLRSATRLLARDGRCQIAALRLDGQPIAMAISIESQDRSYCWKIAFDERFRSQAPGIQLLYALGDRHLARTDLAMTDSCAIANHPMIDRLWPDRVRVCDAAVSLRRDDEADFLASCRREQARRQVRDLAKRAANRLLNRKVN